ITVGPQRVIPLAFAGVHYPEVLAQLHELESAGWDSTLVQPCDFLMLRTSPPAPILEGERRKSSPSPSLPPRPRGGLGWGAEEGQGVRLVEKLQDGPRALWHLAHELGVTHPSLLNTAELESRGDLARIGLTPTDVLHAQGFFTDWSVEAARCGIRLYARRLGLSVEETISALRAAIDEKITAEVVTVLLNQAGVQDGFGNGHPTGRDASIRGFLVKRVLNHAQSGQDKRSAFAVGDNGWSIDLKVHLPLIGIGAPAHAYLPRIASALHAKVTIPEHAEVANAVGAIIGGIVETVEIDVHPVYNVTGIDRYEVRSPVGVCTFPNRELALQHAMKLGEQLATEKAKRAGGEQIEVKLERSDQEAAAGSDSNEPIYLGTRIQATGVGRRMGESVNR
ncbi:hypothetical protein HYR99_22605, partial [Candidatus Poribacteria bacterium]|nr:hypothetical protein [Candidatus Poribacteria bacterium]